MAKNQFMHPLGTAKKQHSAAQPEAGKPLLGEQIRPTPASQGLADPSPRLPSSTPYLPTEQPYLQAPQNLPGIPKLPSMQKARSQAGESNGPKQMGTLVPPNSSSSINPAGNVAGPTNKEIFSPFGSYPQGNFAGPNTLQSRTSHSSPRSAPSYPSAGNSQYLGGKSLANASNLGFAGSPAAAYAGNNSSGGRPGPNGPQGSNGSFQRVAPPPLAPPDPKPPKKNYKRHLPIWARVAIGVVVLLLVVTGGGLAYYETQIAPSLDNILGKQAIHHTSGGQTNNPGTAPTGRTNILLLGSDTDGKGNDPTNGTPLAQTVMIITVDPQTNYVGMLSIPRDMQVTENGYPEPKLDEVFSHGYSGNTLQDKVAAGAGEMEDIIQYNFGIHIDSYAWVGLNGFVKVINTAGGVDVDTIHPMVDDTYPDDVGNTNGSIYDYKRLYIAPGPQHLDGLQALEYVRTRHSDLIGDFGRTIRQQQIINQLKVKLATPDTIGKASELIQDLSGAVQTDMQLNDVIGLANLARGIDSNSIQRLTLGPPDYAVPNTDGVRTSNYLPVCRNIIPAIQKMFNIASPNCVSQFASNGGSIASTASSTTPTAFNTVMASEPKQDSLSSAAFKNKTATNMDTLDAGVHDLLDLVFATTFVSFSAMQV